MSCGWNIFCYVLGDPSPDALNQSSKKASADLIAARASGNKVAEQAALSKMVQVNKKQKAASDRAIGQVNSIDGAVATAGSTLKSIASTGNRVLIVVGLVAAWALFKK